MNFLNSGSIIRPIFTIISQKEHTIIENFLEIQESVKKKKKKPWDTPGLANMSSSYNTQVLWANFKQPCLV